MQFQVLVYITLCKKQISSKKVTMAKWERSAVVTVQIRVRTLLVTWFEFLLLIVA